MRFPIHGWRTINITNDFFIMTIIYFFFNKFFIFDQFLVVTYLIFNSFRIELSMKFHKYKKMMLLNHSLCFWMRIFAVCRNYYTITTTMNMPMTYYQMIHSRNQEIFVFLST